ncbi:MAG: hypothetical protein LBK99_05595 [Opitutaceae bacterium]|nr:hypothetical protein [Opitutaceae bacterium]
MRATKADTGAFPRWFPLAACITPLTSGDIAPPAFGFSGPGSDPTGQSPNSFGPACPAVPGCTVSAVLSRLPGSIPMTCPGSSAIVTSFS